MTGLSVVRGGARIDPSLPVSGSELRRVTMDILAVMGLHGAGLELVCVDDAEMAEYNRKFMGCPGPTNVLSFPAGDGDDALGQIVLSVETLGREAVLYGQDPEEHLVRLMVHAILHLTGMEHGPVMDSATEAILEELFRKREAKR